MRSMILMALLLVAACDNPEPIGPDVERNTKILVDASRDGGGWWFPQAGPFEATAEHQGRALADYLRGEGYTVDELPRGVAITTGLLTKYFMVLRAGFYAPPGYTSAEVAAYGSFLKGGGVLWLVSDFNDTGDGLSAGLDIHLTGAYGGTVTTFAAHPITAGVTSHNFNAGSALSGPIPTGVTVLAWLDAEQTLPIMGTRAHPTGRVFFLGDVNGLEEVPQPLVDNLVAWSTAP